MAHERHPQVNGSSHVGVDLTSVQFCSRTCSQSHPYWTFKTVLLMVVCLYTAVLYLWFMPAMGLRSHSLMLCSAHRTYLLIPPPFPWSPVLTSSTNTGFKALGCYRAAQLACYDLWLTGYFKNCVPLHRTRVHALDRSRILSSSRVP